MRKLIVAGLLWLVAAAPLRAADPLIGYWLIAGEIGHGGVIEIYQNGNAFDGKIVRLESPDYLAEEGADRAGQPRLDQHNADKTLRQRALLGLRVVEGFKLEAPRHYSAARLYRPEDGRTYKGKATLSEDGNTLDVRGYVGVPMLGQTQTWTRLPSPDQLGPRGFKGPTPK